jgi:hypothetical protein
MRRFLSSIIVSAALLAFAAPVFAADTMGSMSKMDKTKLKCAKGETAVAGSMRKDGSMQSAYCRKAKGSAMKDTKMTKETPKAK